MTGSIPLRVDKRTRLLTRFEPFVTREQRRDLPHAPIRIPALAGVVAARAREAGVETVAALRYGVPHEEILRYVDEADVDLTVMGSKARSGDYRRMLGSVTERVSRQSTAPVSIVKATVDA